MSTVTPLEHTAIGGLAGLVEVCISQPTVAIKNALQEGRPIPVSPLMLYRGLLINAGAMLPITATQFGMNRLLEQTFSQVLGTGGGHSRTLFIALGAGASSALFSCPAEMVMIQQQKSGRSLMAELRQLTSTLGIMSVYKGLSPTLVRESLYTAGYLGVAPILREKLSEAPIIGDTPGGPMVASGIAAGLLATVSTQPLDTIKTRMQAFPQKDEYPQYRSMPSTTKYIIETEGFTTLFAGLVPRAARIVLAVFVLTGVRNTAVDLLQKSKSASTTPVG